MNKPVGMICSHSDPAGRPSVYEYAKKQLKINSHIISVGRLDFNSEGLIILTNDGALARTLELPASNIERVFLVLYY
jgi:23S rRNA pseudouridine2605 synthase